VSSVCGGGRYNFPHLVAVESIREALDRQATTGGAHRPDWELGIHYTGNRDDQGDPMGSMALVVSRSGRRRLWFFGDEKRDSVDLGNARKFTS
jgi:hypothetical protein